MNSTVYAGLVGGFPPGYLYLLIHRYPDFFPIDLSDFSKQFSARIGSGSDRQ
jgi:hypothetical protein